MVPTASQAVALGHATESRAEGGASAKFETSVVVTVTGVTEAFSSVGSSPTASQVVAPGGQATPSINADVVVETTPGIPLSRGTAMLLNEAELPPRLNSVLPTARHVVVLVVGQATP